MFYGEGISVECGLGSSVLAWAAGATSIAAELSNMDGPCVCRFCGIEFRTHFDLLNDIPSLQRVGACAGTVTGHMHWQAMDSGVPCPRAKAAVQPSSGSGDIQAGTGHEEVTTPLGEFLAKHGASMYERALRAAGFASIEVSPHTYTG